MRNDTLILGGVYASNRPKQSVINSVIILSMDVGLL